MHLSRFALAAACALSVAAGCSGGKDVAVPLKPKGKNMEFALNSPAFQNGKPIPSKYTGDGLNVSPPLSWSHVPDGTQSFVLICDDPDAPAGTWVHWVLYDIPADTVSVQEGIPREDVVLGSAKHGRTDFKRNGYDGPAPPPGKTHRYLFKLYAVDRISGLPPGRTQKDVLKAIEGHMLAEARWMGTYRR